MWSLIIHSHTFWCARTLTLPLMPRLRTPTPFSPPILPNNPTPSSPSKPRFFQGRHSGRHASRSRSVMRQSGSAAPSSALTVQTLNGGILLTNRVVDKLGALQRRLVVLIDWGERPVGSTEHMGSIHKALKRMVRGRDEGADHLGRGRSGGGTCPTSALS